MGLSAPTAGKGRKKSENKFSDREFCGFEVIDLDFAGAKPPQNIDINKEDFASEVMVIIMIIFIKNSSRNSYETIDKQRNLCYNKDTANRKYNFEVGKHEKPIR